MVTEGIFCLKSLMEWVLFVKTVYFSAVCRAGADGSMSASGSAGPGFDTQQGKKF